MKEVIRRRPKLMHSGLSLWFNKIAIKEMQLPTQQIYNILKEDGWEFFLVQQVHASMAAANSSGLRRITLLQYHLQQEQIHRRKGYFEYVLCHEMSHAMHYKDYNYDFRAINKTQPHGAEFMSWLKKICPKEFIHYELEYKPENAMKAGIFRTDEAV